MLNTTIFKNSFFDSIFRTTKVDHNIRYWAREKKENTRRMLWVIICACWYIPMFAAEYHIPKPNLNPNDEFFLTYRYSTTSRMTATKEDPDSYFFGMKKKKGILFSWIFIFSNIFVWIGFFPIWSAILVCMTGFCLFVSLVGSLCWLVGCTNPRNQMRFESQKLKKQQQDQEIVMMEEQLYDDISVRMIDNTLDRVVDNSTLFSNSRLISEFDTDSKYFIEAKKKKFMRDHL